MESFCAEAGVNVTAEIINASEKMNERFFMCKETILSVRNDSRV